MYCDFNPDNVIQTEEQLKLIDMGGVRGIDGDGPIYGDVYVSWDLSGTLPIFVRHGTIVDIQSTTSPLGLAYGGPGNLSAVIDPRDPKRGDEMGAGTFSKAALAN